GLHIHVGRRLSGRLAAQTCRPSKTAGESRLDANKLPSYSFSAPAGQQLDRGFSAFFFAFPFL
ncbi:MAG: hypothetical protein ABIQ90_17760, partial [Polaromonas sp.]